MAHQAPPACFSTLLCTRELTWSGPSGPGFQVAWPKGGAQSQGNHPTGTDNCCPCLLGLRAGTSCAPPALAGSLGKGSSGSSTPLPKLFSSSSSRVFQPRAGVLQHVTNISSSNPGRCQLGIQPQGDSCHMPEWPCPSPQRPSESGEEKLKLKLPPRASWPEILGKIGRSGLVNVSEKESHECSLPGDTHSLCLEGAWSAGQVHGLRQHWLIAGASQPEAVGYMAVPLPP